MPVVPLLSSVLFFCLFPFLFLFLGCCLSSSFIISFIYVSQIVCPWQHKLWRSNSTRGHSHLWAHCWLAICDARRGVALMHHLNGHAHAHALMHACTHSHAHAHARPCLMHTHTHVVQAYALIHTCTHTHTPHTHMHAHAHSSYTHTRTLMHTHTHTHNPLYTGTYTPAHTHVHGWTRTCTRPHTHAYATTHITSHRMCPNCKCVFGVWFQDGHPKVEMFSPAGGGTDDG